MKPYYRNTLATINLDALSYNIKSLESIHQSKLIAVVKANAYGHGDLMVVKHLESLGIDFFAVASLDEALNLRIHGVQSDILLLGYLDPRDVQEAIQYNIVCSALTLEWVQSLPEAKGLRVHLKVNTGLNRFGILPSEVSNALNHLDQKGAVVEGIFTHFASSDVPGSTQTQEQYDRFVEVLENNPRNYTWIHSSNSGAAVHFKTPHCNAVRIGLSLYGYSDYPCDLKPVMTLTSELHDVKLVKKGESIGYGASYHAIDDEWIGTVSMGYADGLHRLYQGAQCWVNGSLCEYIGRISMDISVIRLPKHEAIHTQVEILGPHIDIYALAKHIGTIPYELFTMISDRVPRVYIKNTKQVAIVHNRFPSAKIQ